MGDVYRAVHVGQGVPVAIKVLTSRRARDRRFHARFADEVHAVARLDHPGIVRVFDHGRVGRDDAFTGRLVAGSPYLAMELASEGALADLPVRLEWPALQALLLDLLEALGHAHARGVVHRDLKPGNVLRCGGKAPASRSEVDGAETWKLADWGIAWALHNDPIEKKERPTGTPLYMAPEQFRADWRDYGPWTDLYALGGLAWELATGEPPFGRLSTAELQRAHLFAEPPPLAPRVRVPSGLEPWLLRLLQKDPGNRWERAADAALALRELGPPDVEPVDGDAGPWHPMTIVPEDFDDVDESSSSSTRRFPALDVVDRELVREKMLSRLAGRAEPRRPPFPATWASPGDDAPADPLHGVGLGVYGVRPIPLVGRNEQRDRLWASLAAVDGDGKTRAVLLSGVAGVGKSRLAEWLGQRAHELGVAHVLSATHGPLGGPTEGLGRMLAAALKTVGLTRAEVEVRVAHHLRDRGVDAPDLYAALADVVAPSERNRFASPAERWEVVARYVRELGRPEARPEPSRLVEARPARPVVVWLDDVQWGADALGFAEYALRRADVPALLVLTARDEALAERPLEAARLDDVLATGRCERVEVGALPSAERGDLVRRLLGLSGDLAARVEARTGGNPLFAIHLVGDWVQRGVLVARDDGFALRDGETAVLPDDLHQVWRERLDRLREGDDLSALEIAAALGQDVDAGEWRAACEVAGVTPSEDLVGRLVAGRLARGLDRGWAFGHGMLRECLERQARERGTWVGWHRACAAMLAGRGDEARRGRHLLAAGDLEDALEPLRTGARRCGERSEYRDAHALLDVREDALRRLGAQRGVRWHEGGVVRAWVHQRQGRLPQARAEAERVIADIGDGPHADAPEAAAVRAEALEHRAYCLRHTGRLAAAREAYAVARDAWALAGDDAGVASCVLNLGGLARVAGRVEEAERLHREALATFERLDHKRGLAFTVDGLGLVAKTRGNLDEAIEHHLRAMRLFEEIGDLVGRAEVWRGLAEIARVRGELDEADALNQRAIALLEDAGSDWVGVYRVYPGLVQLWRGDFAGAAATLARAVGAMQALDQLHYVGAVSVILSVCAAVGQDWGGFDELLARGERLLRETGFVERDVAEAARFAAQIAGSMGQAERAGRATALADELDGALARSAG